MQESVNHIDSAGYTPHGEGLMSVTGFMLRTIAKRGYDGIGTDIADNYLGVN